MVAEGVLSPGREVTTTDLPLQWARRSPFGEREILAACPRTVVGLGGMTAPRLSVGGAVMVSMEKVEVVAEESASLKKAGLALLEVLRLSAVICGHYTREEEKKKTATADKTPIV